MNERISMIAGTDRNTDPAVIDAVTSATPAAATAKKAAEIVTIVLGEDVGWRKWRRPGL